MNIQSALSSYKVWVLAPYLHTDDPNLQYYYDFTEGIKEYTRVFDELKCEWEWQPVGIHDYNDIIRQIGSSANGKQPLVINLCDGDEINGTPGVSVIEALKKEGLVFTGSNRFFYEITTSKIPMKQAFEAAGVPTPKWEVMTEDGSNLNGLFNRIGSPLILKPAISGGSMGIGIKNVVHTEEECITRLEEMRGGYHGWDLAGGGIIAEAFIKGREFTTLVVGSGEQELIFYPPAERLFHQGLPDTEQFLSYDRLWETYEDEKPVDNDQFLYNYGEPEAELLAPLREMSLAAYKAVGGTGYGRIDIRMDKETGNMYVLEVNAQCGLSEDENFTSIGAILRFARKSFTQLTCEILEDALKRHKP
ncbi:MAG: ATP-grasp domain-containing protein [Chitinophagaceae bacterium]|nr:ATP-grasp domain-containing protein [Chitinophagaceae bacterium]